MTEIMYIHGFKGNHQSDKVQALHNAFPDCTVTSFPIPEKASEAFHTIWGQIINSKSADIILVGTSLGAFWAHYFADRFILKSVLMNPCIDPANQLLDLVGTPRAVGFTAEDAEEYADYKIDLTQPHYQRTVLLEEGDEIFSSRVTAEIYKDIAKVVMIPGGNHRFTSYDRMVQEVRELKNQEILFPIE
jgi:predicted esterase YcpF (UPF0227 family)